MRYCFQRRMPPETKDHIVSDNPDVAELAHRLPSKGPHAGAAEDLRLWGELGRLSNASVADSAGKWRAGTAGLFTALTGLLFISGQDAGSLAEPWRFWVIGCVVAAAVAVMISLWCALAAEAPPIATLDYQKIIGEHGSVPGYQASVAETGARLLSYSRWATVAGLILFLLGSALWLLAPQPASSAPVTVTYEHQAKTKILCGDLLTTHAGAVLFSVAGEERPIPVQLAEIRDISAVSACPG